MRKLVSIQSISDIRDLENSDYLAIVRVLGWNVVVKRNEFQVGDKIVYVEVDTILPESDKYLFLRADKFRVRTKRIRGQISQGLCLPLDVLPEGEYTIGEDVTEIIGANKYEPPLSFSLDSDVKGVFPGFIPKTDETRVQNLAELISKYKGTDCIVTEKIDGTSMTVYYRDGNIGVCGRNSEFQRIPDNIYWKTADKYGIEEKLNQLKRNVAIQGELFGYKIQGNKYELRQSEVRFMVFNIFDIDSYEYLSFDEFESIINTMNACKTQQTTASIETVPVLSRNFRLIDDVDKIVEMSEGKSILNNKTIREGIVIKSFKEIYDKDFNTRVSIKAINPRFLLKYE